MITQEEKNLLTQTGRGTPCGELMRRFWQPAALSEELGTEKPLPVTLLGEELVLFRDGEGKPALIGRYCAHQGVDMIYGRVEQDGIRCMYHGWLFDACGKVIVRGDWVEGGEKRMEVGQPAYPCAEIGGVILTYMGPGETPGLPVHEFVVNPRRVSNSQKFSAPTISCKEYSAPTNRRLTAPCLSRRILWPFRSRRHAQKSACVGTCRSMTPLI